MKFAIKGGGAQVQLRFFFFTNNCLKNHLELDQVYCAWLKCKKEKLLSCLNCALQDDKV